MSQQDWQHHRRHDPLSADPDDASPGVQEWLRERQRPRRQALLRIANVFGVLALFGLSLYLLGEYSGLSRQIAAKAQGLLSPAPAIAFKPIDPTPPASAAADHIAQPLEPTGPASPTSAAPQPLADCIKSANLIDEQVVACRYGELPRSREPSPNRGMVSPQYLAQYQAERDQRNNAPARRSVSRDVDQVWIKGWNGGSSYLAEWHALDNRIDSSSVCANHRKGSIDYRECRKAAKVHFREQCRTWEVRWENDRKEFSKQREERYCSAAGGFSPMG
jgi:hypothetical protein